MCIGSCRFCLNFTWVPVYPPGQKAVLGTWSSHICLTALFSQSLSTLVSWNIGFPGQLVVFCIHYSHLESVCYFPCSSLVLVVLGRSRRLTRSGEVSLSQHSKYSQDLESSKDCIGKSFCKVWQSLPLFLFGKLTGSDLSRPNLYAFLVLSHHRPPRTSGDPFLDSVKGFVTHWVLHFRIGFLSWSAFQNPNLATDQWSVLN